jgi:hypothetical protein
MFGFGIFRAGRMLARAATGGRARSAATAPSQPDTTPTEQNPPRPYLDPSIDGLGFRQARQVRRAASDGLSRKERRDRASRRMADVREMQRQGIHDFATLYRMTTQQPEAGDH